MWHLTFIKKLMLSKTPNTWDYPQTLPPSPTPSPYTPLLKYPVYYFLCGPMADPTTLKQTLHLDEEPELREAYITGYSMTRRNDHPALIDGPQGAVVNGSAYFVSSAEEGERLRGCHSEDYRVSACSLYLLDGEEVTTVSGTVFKYAGDARVLSPTASVELDWVDVALESLGDS